MAPLFANTDIDCKVLGNNITLSKISNVATRIAQQTRQEKKTAKGNVIDSTGEPVIGASVVEQGTTNGTVTDINGNFTLNLSTPNAKIEISFIGYNVLGSLRFAEKTIEDELISSQIESDVRNLIELLPEEQREVVMMRYYSGMSFKEIAEQTGVSINTALGRMRYALINLRRMIREKELILS
jgi:RNA polymerase sigma factor (sigma-70 family)